MPGLARLIKDKAIFLKAQSLGLSKIRERRDRENERVKEGRIG